MNHPASANGKIDACVASPICACGGSKKEGKPFCMDCIASILDAGKTMIYRNLYRNDEKFYIAYDDALEFLKEHGDIR